MPMHDTSGSVDPFDARLIDRLQGGFPLDDRPFASVAAEFGLDEDELIERLRHMLAIGVLTRFGPLFQIERAGGQCMLAALRAPEQRFEQVSAQVNALPEVARNCRREHEFNMWFVLAAESPAEVDMAIERIERETGLRVYACPKEREYLVELRLPAQKDHGT